MWCHIATGWKHGKVYIKSCWKKYQVKKEVIFCKNTRKYIQILLKFHFETIEPMTGFIVNQLQNFKNFGIVKVDLKLIRQYSVQTYFSIRKFNEIYMYEVIA